MASRPKSFVLSTIGELGAELREGLTSCDAIATDFLRRIEIIDARLGAFTYVAKEQALLAARELDRQLAAGSDLGPLMGMPVAVKDLYTVRGMPTTAGSELDVSDVVPPEGSFVA